MHIGLAQPVEIPVNPQAVCDTRMASTISPGGDPGAPKVQTIEHLMSACAGLGEGVLAEPILAETRRNLYDGVPLDELASALLRAGLEAVSAPLAAEATK